MNKKVHQEAHQQVANGSDSFSISDDVQSKFYHRGEGMANYVIGFRRSDQHMIWRIRKKDVHDVCRLLIDNNVEKSASDRLIAAGESDISDRSSGVISDRLECEISIAQSCTTIINQTTRDVSIDQTETDTRMQTAPDNVLKHLITASANRMITSIDNDLELSIRFIRDIIAPLFDQGGAYPSFLTIPKPVEIPTDQLIEIIESKIISIFEDERRSISITSKLRELQVLEMPDFTIHIPGSEFEDIVSGDFRRFASVDRSAEIDYQSVDLDCSKNMQSTEATSRIDQSDKSRSDRYRFPVIGVEIKVKQGFIPKDVEEHSKKLFADFGDFAFCTNCISQYEKCDDRTKMYDYCPLDLYSGEKIRMRRALIALIRQPRRHLRLFLNGHPVLDEKHRMSESDVGQLLFGNEKVDGLDFIDLLIRVLLYSRMGDTGERRLPKGSVLDMILQAQCTAELGPFRAATVAEELKSVIPDPTDAFPFFFDDFGGEVKAKVDQLRRSLICQTMRDCSVMLAMQLENRDPIRNIDRMPDFRPIRISDGLWLKFNINVIDMDAKTPAKAIVYGKRLLRGLELIKADLENGSFRRVSCHSRDNHGKM